MATWANGSIVRLSSALAAWVCFSFPTLHHPPLILLCGLGHLFHGRKRPKLAAVVHLAFSPLVPSKSPTITVLPTRCVSEICRSPLICSQSLITSNRRFPSYVLLFGTPCQDSQHAEPSDTQATSRGPVAALVLQQWQLS